jgi:hypothetical protein
MLGFPADVKNLKPAITKIKIERTKPKERKAFDKKIVSFAGSETKEGKISVFAKTKRGIRKNIKNKNFFIIF